MGTLLNAFPSLLMAKRYNEALSVLYKTEELINDNTTAKSRARIYESFRVVHLRTGDYEESIANGIKAIEYRRLQGSKPRLAISALELAKVLRIADRDDEAIDYFNTAKDNLGSLYISSYGYDLYTNFG